MTKRKRKSVTAMNVEWTWHWRSIAAVVYLAICLSDFLIMPMYREYSYTRMPVNKMVEVARTMDDGVAQIETLRILKEDRVWTPITNDMFHLSFGAILGVSALPMNRKNKQKNEEDDEEDGDISADSDGEKM